MMATKDLAERLLALNTIEFRNEVAPFLCEWYRKVQNHITDDCKGFAEGFRYDSNDRYLWDKVLLVIADRLKESGSEGVTDEEWEAIAVDVDDRFGYGCLECSGFGMQQAREIVGAVLRVLGQRLASAAKAEARVRELAQLCAEVYQVVGALSGDRFENSDVQAVLDNLEAGADGAKLPHKTLLPFYGTSSERAEEGGK